MMHADSKYLTLNLRSYFVIQIDMDLPVNNKFPLHGWMESS